MTQISLPIGATNSGTNDWSDVHGEDQAITDVVNGNLDSTNLAANAVTTAKITDLNVTSGKLASGAALANLASASVTDAKLASPNNSVYRTLFQATSFVARDLTAKTILLGSTEFGTGVAAFGAGVSPESVGVDTGGFGFPPSIFYFDDADYTVGGLTQKLRLRCQVSANATAPAINFTFGLYPVTVAGGADTVVITAGTVVSGSTQALNTPSASAVTSGVNSDFTIPSDGAYVLGVATSGTLANNSAVILSAQLQTRNV